VPTYQFPFPAGQVAGLESRTKNRPQGPVAIINPQKPFFPSLSEKSDCKRGFVHPEYDDGHRKWKRSRTDCLPYDQRNWRNVTVLPKIAIGRLPEILGSNPESISRAQCRRMLIRADMSRVIKRSGRIPVDTGRTRHTSTHTKNRIRGWTNGLKVRGISGIRPTPRRSLRTCLLLTENSLNEKNRQFRIRMADMADDRNTKPDKTIRQPDRR